MIFFSSVMSSLPRFDLYSSPYEQQRGHLNLLEQQGECQTTPFLRPNTLAFPARTKLGTYPFQKHTEPPVSSTATPSAGKILPGCRPANSIPPPAPKEPDPRMMYNEPTLRNINDQQQASRVRSHKE